MTRRFREGPLDGFEEEVEATYDPPLAVLKPRFEREADALLAVALGEATHHRYQLFAHNAPEYAAYLWQGAV